jgi:c(7)-type cytochrome triheme protein
VLFSTAVKYLPVFPSEETENATETADGEWLAPNVLRQPLFSSTTLALVLGGLFLGGSLLLGANGLWYRMQMKNVSASKAALSPPGFAGRYFTMPPDVTLPTTEASPGQVTFRHSSHLDANQANCTQCHNQRFRILKAKVSNPATAGAQDLHSAQFCRACHDGEKSFSVKEDCQLCHSM